jgi:hypothetical protein
VVIDPTNDYSSSAIEVKKGYLFDAPFKSQITLSNGLFTEIEISDVEKRTLLRVRTQIKDCFDCKFCKIETRTGYEAEYDEVTVNVMASCKASYSSSCSPDRPKPFTMQDIEADIEKEANRSEEEGRVSISKGSW